MWLIVVLFTALIYVLPLSHGLLFMPRFLAQASLMHVNVYLNSNVDSLGFIINMQPADLLEF